MNINYPKNITKTQSYLRLSSIINAFFFQNLYEKMSYWSHHKNSEMVLLGMKAIESFLTQVGVG